MCYSAAVDVTAASLRPFPLLRSSSDEALATLVSHAERQVVPHGQLLWRMGQRPAWAHFIVRGLVQIVKRLPSGDEVSLGLFGPSEVAGILAVLGPSESIYPADAVAVSDDVHVIRVPSAALKAAIESDPAIARSANAVLVGHAQLLRAKIDVLTAGDISQRIATLLVHLAERFGDVASTGEVIIPVALSRGSLSRLVGARDETVIRVMTRWEREGLVETTKTGFVVKSAHQLAALQSPPER